MGRFFLGIFSFFLVAFAQNAWLGFLGPFAASIGYALFWQALFKKRSWSFIFGMIWFAAVQAIQLSWFTSTEYMGSLIWLVYVGLILGMGAQFGFLTWLIGRYHRQLRIVDCLAISGIWAVFEWMRIWLFSGFTWNLSGLALTTSIYSLQMAAFVGIYGLSFWVIFVNLLALRGFNRLRPSVWIVFGCCAIVPYLLGAVQLSLSNQAEKKLSIVLVQPSLLPEQRDYDPQYPQLSVTPLDQWDRILGFVQQASQKSHPELIVLPEGTFPNDAFHAIYCFNDMKQIWIDRFGPVAMEDFPDFAVPKEHPWSQSLEDEEGEQYWYVCNAFWAQALSNHYQSEVIVGMDEWDSTADRHFNAAFHFSPHRNQSMRSEKRILVPLSEYIPFKGWKVLADFVAHKFGINGSFDAGDRAKIFKGSLPMGVSICYEELYTQIIRELRAAGARLFVNISNDVWFPKSRLPKQHFDHGMVRAVENGIPLVRACNTGITGGVDCFGRMLNSYPENQAGALLIQVPLQMRSTLYSYWGDSLVLGFSMFCILGWLGLSLKKRTLD